jgi:aminopeptidase N
MHSLTQLEAIDRAVAVVVETYSVDVDVTSPDSFRSTATVRFRATRPGDTTFVEIKPTALRSVTLNGAPLDGAALDGNRLAVGPLAGDNVLVVDADMAYSNTGQGLHRFVDPADGETYLYAMSFLDEAQRTFACFDQPDLKARFTLAVTAPSAWTVAANAPVAGTTPVGTGATRWEFAESKPLATYFVSFIAGPYHRLEGGHDGIPLAVYCKRSLAPHLDRDAHEILEVTGQCLDRFHELFGVRYPFGKYDQAFVPEFNAGAMENPGLVTIRDDYVFRSAVTDSERELRATTIAHEMAHMWFGDLVTMRWWDDLWLNESFAEYMGTRVTAEATRFRGAWTTFGMRRKGWGYNADQRPSTHTVAPAAVTDAAEALTNFDGISFAKGASVLRQLTAWVGDEAFLAGVRAHFAGHGYGNATLADLLSELSAASGRDLSGWAHDWLRTAQLNRLRSEVTVDEAGTYADVAITQEAPASHPTLRPHRIGVGLYDDAADDAALRERVEVDVLGARTALPGLTGRRAAGLLLLNDGDLTFAKVRLDPASAASVPRLLPRLGDSLARAVVWTAMTDAVRDAELPVTDLVDPMTAALPGESEVAIVTDMLTTGRNLVERYLAGDARRIERGPDRGRLRHPRGRRSGPVDPARGDPRPGRHDGERGPAAGLAGRRRRAPGPRGRRRPALADRLPAGRPRRCRRGADRCRAGGRPQRARRGVGGAVAVWPPRHRGQAAGMADPDRGLRRLQPAGRGDGGGVLPAGAGRGHRPVRPAVLRGDARGGAQPPRLGRRAGRRAGLSPVRRRPPDAGAGGRAARPRRPGARPAAGRDRPGRRSSPRAGGCREVARLTMRR